MKFKDMKVTYGQRLWQISIDKFASAFISVLTYGTMVGMLPVRFTSKFPDEEEKEGSRPATTKKITLSSLSMSKLDWKSISEFRALRKLRFVHIHADTLDLEGIGQCSELVDLIIYRTEFAYLNLDPLSDVPKLRRLIISQNRISKLDLTPLSRLSNLKTLWIEEPVENLSLEPLRACSLESLAIGIKQPWNIDLEPLMNQSRRSFRLTIKQLQSSDVISDTHAIDMTPVVDFYMKNIDSSNSMEKEIAYFLPAMNQQTNALIRSTYEIRAMNHFIERWGWARMRSVIETHISVVESRAKAKKFMLQEEVLKSFKLGWLAGLDADILALIVNIQDDSSFEQLRQKIITESCDILSEQLMRGGSTLFFDIDEMRKYPELARHIPTLIEQRNREMIEATILYDGCKYYDLTNVWLTHYGYQILSNMQFEQRLSGLKVFTLDFEPIQRLLETYKVPVVTSRNHFKDDSLSEGMREYLKIRAQISSQGCF